MSQRIEVRLTGTAEDVERAARNLRDVLDVVDEETEEGDGGMIRKMLVINSHSSRINRIDVTVWVEHPAGSGS